MTTTLEQLISQSRDSWRADAACSSADTAIFFIGPGKSPAAALATCGGCEVRLACLEYALDNEEDYGIWGGLNADQRAKLRRRRIDTASSLQDSPAARAGPVPPDPVVLLPATQSHTLV